MNLGALLENTSRLNVTNVKASEINQALLAFNNNRAVIMNPHAPDYVKKGYEENNTVFSIVRFITRKYARLNWVLNEVKETNKAKAHRIIENYKSINPIGSPSQLAKKLLMKEKEFEEVDGHRILDIIHQPNSLQGKAEFFENQLGFKLITGNSYAHLPRPRGGQNAGLPQEMWIMPSHLTVIDAGDWKDPIRSYTIGWNSGTKITVPADQVWHSKYFSTDYTSGGTWLAGLSPIGALAKVLTKNNDSYTAAVKKIQNNGAEGVLWGKGGVWDESGKEQAGILEKKYKEKFSGPYNRGKIMIAPGEMGWTTIGSNLKDMELNASLLQDLRDVCNVYSLNSAIFNDPENKTFNNMKEARKAAWTDAILVEADSTRFELNRDLVKPYAEKEGKNYFVDYDIHNIEELQEDMAKLAERLQGAEEFTDNEKRVMQGLDPLPIPAMDIPRVSINKVPIDQLGIEPPPDDNE